MICWLLALAWAGGPDPLVGPVPMHPVQAPPAARVLPPPAMAVPIDAEPVDPVAQALDAARAGQELVEVESTMEVEDEHSIVVYGDVLVERAFQEVIDGLVEEGYEDIVDKGDYVRLRHPQPWKGEVRLYDDGWVRMKRQPVQFVGVKVPWAPKDSPGAYISCILYPWACLKLGGQTVGRRKMMAQKERVLGKIYPDVQVLGDRIADRETEETVNELPGQLEALWYEGEPLDGKGPRLKSMQERKDALLAFWESRTDTVWGDRVRLAVEAFLRAEVQTSDTPITAAEVRAVNDRRTCARSLDLDSPWSVVSADVEMPW